MNLGGLEKKPQTDAQFARKIVQDITKLQQPSAVSIQGNWVLTTNKKGDLIVTSPTGQTRILAEYGEFTENAQKNISFMYQKFELTPVETDNIILFDALTTVEGPTNTPVTYIDIPYNGLWEFSAQITFNNYNNSVTEIRHMRRSDIISTAKNTINTSNPVQHFITLSTLMEINDQICVYNSNKSHTIGTVSPYTTSITGRLMVE